MAVRRKFESSEAFAPRGIQVSVVGSPIPEDRARKMTNASWLRAIRRYSTEEQPSGDWMKGGAVQLSHALEQRAKEEPERFAKLALQLPNDIDENYADAILRGLGNAEHSVSVDLLAQVLRHFFEMPGKPGRALDRPAASTGRRPRSTGRHSRHRLVVRDKRTRSKPGHVAQGSRRGRRVLRRGSVPCRHQ